MIPDPSPPFEFELSAVMRERIRDLLELARDRHCENEASRAIIIMHILRLLKMEPRVWGDPICNYRQLKLTQYHGRLWNLRCVYAVHDRIPIVFLTEIVPQVGCPLYTPDEA